MRFQYHNLLWVFLGGALIILVFSLGRSGSVAEPEMAPSITEKHGPVKNFDGKGNLKTIVMYDHGVKQGISSTFYENGQVMLEMPYQEGLREGESRKYYKDGSLYAVTPYTNDEVNGTRVTYFRNGRLKAEIPYYRSLNGLGLKEYFVNGEAKELPKIAVAQRGGIWYFSIPDCNKATFYTGALLNNRFLAPDADLVKPLPSSLEGAYLSSTEVGSGSVNVLCRCTTRSGNPYLTRIVLKK